MKSDQYYQLMFIKSLRRTGSYESLVYADILENEMLIKEAQDCLSINENKK